MLAISTSCRLLGLALAIAGVAWVGAACSSSSGGSPERGADSGKPDSRASDAGSLRKLDSSSDAVEILDTSLPPRDASTYAWNDAAPSCQPSSPAGFAPVAVAAVKNHACTTAQVAGVVTQCFDPSTATGSTCATWSAVVENHACLDGCPVISAIASAPALQNPPPAPTGPWGPLVEVVSHGSMTFVNIGGCVAAADPSAAGQACAGAINAQLECEYYVCAANCPIPETADASATNGAEQAFENCMLAADSGPCSTYAEAANACISALPADAPEQYCLDGSLLSQDSVSFDPAFEELIGDMCGGKPRPDGGPEDAGPKDASDGAAPADASLHG